MIKLIMIRHGKTKGNLQKRYVGSTDEPLLERSGQELQNYCLPDAERIIVSPLKRCIETADILYPKQIYKIAYEFREKDFGQFEYKNYEELKDNPDYQNWLSHNGTTAFPGGEDTRAFKKRCITEAKKQIEAAIKQNISSMTWIVHGGTIMAVLEAFSDPHKDFYSWQVKNREGYCCMIDETEWLKKEYYFKSINYYRMRKR